MWWPDKPQPVKVQWRQNQGPATADSQCADGTGASAKGPAASQLCDRVNPFQVWVLSEPGHGLDSKQTAVADSNIGN